MTEAEQLADLLAQEGIRSPEVLEAITNTPRHEFVPEEMRVAAYQDEPLPIGEGQTISQPFVVARMTELLLSGSEPVKKVLEIGTGSGYQAAVLAALVDDVYTVERFASLSEQAASTFTRLGYKNIHTHYGDGFLGWDEHAPYDAIIVTAAAPDLPIALIAQLRDGGKMVIPVGYSFDHQDLTVVKKIEGSIEVTRLDPVVFVPMKHGQA